MSAMLEVKFYDNVDDALLKFAVVVARYNGKWIFCKHKMRPTFEVPGGHREPGETIFQTALRELREETGATDFSIKPVCVYSVTGKNRTNHVGNEQFGMLYYAEVSHLGNLGDFEMEAVSFFNEVPLNLTYPEIQPNLVDKVASAFL